MRRLPQAVPAVVALAAPPPPSAAAGSASAAAAMPSASTALARCQAQAVAARRALSSSDAVLADLAWFKEPDEGQLAAAWERSARQLQGSPEARQRAAGLLMGRLPSHLPGAVPAPPADVTSLVSLALASSDPTALLWAVNACAAQASQAACQGLSPRIWVAAEPDNLLAWLPLLAREPQAREEALQGMAQARRADGGWMRWAAVVNAARPADLSAELRLAFGSRLLSRAAALPIPAWQGLLAACKDDALADARRRGQCDQIARLMVDQGRELVTVYLGYAIGKGLGWPPEREQDHQALRSAARQLGPDLLGPGSSSDCDALRLDHWLERVESSGEVELLRQALRAEPAAAQPPR